MARTYVITGSASGIGAATAAKLRAEGHRVIGVDVHDADVVADLSTADGRAAMIEGVREASGGVVDAVIANAGLAHPLPVTVSVNYFGAVATLEGLLPLLTAGTDPRAVATCSMAVLGPLDDAIVEACLAGDEAAALAAAEGKEMLIYGSTKRALARWIRRQAPTAAWAGAGIPLNAVGPGVIETPMVAPFLATEEGRHMIDDAVPMPLGGFGRPEEVAELLCWLTSPANTMTTGQVIFIDGGSDVVLRGDDIW